jgi:3-hydroxyacyl-[acyl-carrier-protein] dehydratase
MNARTEQITERRADGSRSVPSRFLFDISQIDLRGVAVSAEEVGQIIPQCGDMRQLDHVIWMSDEASRGMGVKHVRDDEFWVPGHIPGRPLMPGVLMIEAAAQLSSILYHRKVEQPDFVGFTRCDEVAFRGQVVPGDALYLLAEEVTFKKRRFICRTQGVVDGKLVFEGKVTGMVL